MLVCIFDFQLKRRDWEDTEYEENRGETTKPLMRMQPNEVTGQIIGAAIDVHREVGPGQDEIVYEDALALALEGRRLRFRRQPPLPVHYKGVKLDCGFRPDFVVEELVAVEGKAAENVHPVFEAQVRTYQRLGGWTLGLLLNFEVPVMKEGIRRFIVNAAEFRNAPAVSTEVGRTQRDTLPDSDLTGAVVAAAVEVHRFLGAGLLTSVYAACFQHELVRQQLRFETGKKVSLTFGGQKLGHPAQLALVVEERLAVEVLAVAQVLPVHEARLHSQMRLGKLPLGLRFNFHETRLVDGIRRFTAPSAPAV